MFIYLFYYYICIFKPQLMACNDNSPRQELINLRDKEALETADICLRIVSTLIAVSGAILILSIELTVSGCSNPRSWLLRTSTLLYLLCTLSSLIALGILLIRRIRRVDRIGAKAANLDNATQNADVIDIGHSPVEFYVLLVCVVASFGLFASATITLGLYALLSYRCVCLFV